MRSVAYAGNVYRNYISRMGISGSIGTGRQMKSVEKKSTVNTSRVNSSGKISNRTKNIINSNKYRTMQYRRNLNLSENSIPKSIKTATTGIRNRSERLLDTGKESLFAKAKKENSTKNVVGEINSFVEDYNNMINNMNKTQDKLNYTYKSKLANDVLNSKSDLNAIGVTEAKNGNLAVDQKVLENAKIADLQKVFGGATSFGGNVAVKSIYIEANSVSQMSQSNMRTFGYNGAGGYRDYGAYRR